MVDPNLYYSRFSFFESSREAINIKFEKSKRQMNGPKKFFTRSALVQQLIPNPAEGQVRAMFGTGKCSASEALFAKTAMRSSMNFREERRTSRISAYTSGTQKHRKAGSNQGGITSHNPSTHELESGNVYGNQPQGFLQQHR